MNDFLYLNDQQLANLKLSAEEIIAAIKDTLRGVQKNEVAVAPKSGVTTADGRYVMATLSLTDTHGIIAVKSVVFNPHNRKKNLPSIDGGIMLLDSETGKLKAVLDANWITAARTAGLSLVAARHLANPQSQSIGLIGAGVQAESHLRAFNQCYPLNRVRVVSRGSGGINRILNVAKELQLEFKETDANTCIEQSDIVVSAVTRDPDIESFLDARLMSAGAFASIADLAIPWCLPTMSNFGRIYIDDLNQERAMDNKLLDSGLISGDLNDLANHHVSYDPNLSSAFVFRGIAAGDLALAVLAYQRFLEKSDG